jgi:hypothetical protein
MSQATVRTSEKMTAAGSSYRRAVNALGCDDLDAAAWSWVATHDHARTILLLKNATYYNIA